MTAHDADDDFPVLTQILRTGDGTRVEQPPPEAVEHPSGHLDPVARTGSSAVAFGIEPYLGDGGTHPYGTLPRETEASPPADRRPAEEAFEPLAASPVRWVDEVDAATTAGHGVPSAEDWDALAARVRASVLDDLGARVDTEFDARIAQVLHTEIETAVAQLQQVLRDHLAEALGDVVGRAIEAEVVRLRAAAAGEPID